MRQQRTDSTCLCHQNLPCLAFVFLAVVTLVGCRGPQVCCDRRDVSRELNGRAFSDVVPESCPGEVSIPPVVNLDDGLTQDESAAIALWNNRDFLATLSNLGVARGDLVQAGLLTNPQMSLLFPPIGTKQLEWTVFLPIDALLLRKKRIEVAESDLQRICNELVQNGLNVARDARIAFADFQFAVDRYQLAAEAVEVRAGIAELAQKRLDAGDIGELELITARVDANRARADAAGLERAVRIAEAKLRNVLGIVTLDSPLFPVSPESFRVPALDADLLASEALLIRPDAKAARVAVQAARHRVELAQKSFLRIDGVADGNSGGAGPTNSGPGLRFELPIFNRNQGLVIRSQWTVDQASHNYYSVRDRIVTEVRTAVASVEQANESLTILRESVLPQLEDAVEISRASYRDGGDGYVLVLQSISQFVDSRIQELQLSADLRRALAELDRSVGRRVFTDGEVEHTLSLQSNLKDTNSLDFDYETTAPVPYDDGFVEE
ncbi:MAG: TolC family protein [Planctomycetales bacterium]|nr:TolC family protein [Planctomycetales bacterium]